MEPPRRRDYRTYTEAERRHIVAVAEAEGLSATRVQERFGVKPVTYYLWRKKSGLRSPRGRRPERKLDGQQIAIAPANDAGVGRAFSRETPSPLE